MLDVEIPAETARRTAYRGGAALMQAIFSRISPARAAAAAVATGQRCWYNLRASFVQAHPNKTKEKSLHFLLFHLPNQDFSKG
jgi:hypothetical protein